MQILGVEEPRLWPHDMPVQILILLQVRWSVYEMWMHVESSAIALTSSSSEIGNEKKETVDDGEEEKGERGERGENSEGLRTAEEDA